MLPQQIDGPRLEGARGSANQSEYRQVNSSSWHFVSSGLAGPIVVKKCSSRLVARMELLLNSRNGRQFVSTQTISSAIHARFATDGHMFRLAGDWRGRRGPFVYCRQAHCVCCTQCRIDGPTNDAVRRRGEQGSAACTGQYHSVRLSGIIVSRQPKQFDIIFSGGQILISLSVDCSLLARRSQLASCTLLSSFALCALPCALRGRVGRLSLNGTQPVNVCT